MVTARWAKKEQAYNTQVLEKEGDKELGMKRFRWVGGVCGGGGGLMHVHAVPPPCKQQAQAARRRRRPAGCASAAAHHPAPRLPGVLACSGLAPPKLKPAAQPDPLWTAGSSGAKPAPCTTLRPVSAGTLATIPQHPTRPDSEQSRIQVRAWCVVCNRGGGKGGRGLWPVLPCCFCTHRSCGVCTRQAHRS